MNWLLQASIGTFLLCLAGGLVPFVFRRTDRLQHLLIAFATGVFLGATFLHLLPAVAEITAAHDSEDEARSSLWLVVLFAVLALYLIENLTIHRGAHRVAGHGKHDDLHRHRTVGFATLFGLSVHAFTSGFSLSAAVENPELRGPMLASILSHKSVESFSLTAVFLLAGLHKRTVLALVVGFSLVTPLGVWVGAWLVPSLDGFGLQVVTALAAGTFLFVALCDLLPEVFHHQEDAWKKTLLIVAGVSTGVLVHSLGH